MFTESAGLRRSEPSSRTILTGEQPDPSHLLQQEDMMSRHRSTIGYIVIHIVTYTVRLSLLPLLVYLPLIERVGASVLAFHIKESSVPN